MKTIRLFATVRDVVGRKNINVPFQAGDTVRNLIDAINANHPQLGEKLLDESGALSSSIHIYVRGRNIEWLNGLDTMIGESDDVFVVPPIAGG
jgi:sulfur-carrier protein